MIPFIKNLSDRTIVILGTFLLIGSFVTYFVFSNLIITLLGFISVVLISVLRIIELKNQKKQWDNDSYMVMEKIERRKK